jgi:hypothetical protein
MSDFDLERLGDVWRQQLDPAEMERLQRTAATVGRRARLAQLFDLGAALIVSTVVILLVWLHPTTQTMLIGGGAIVVMLVGQMRQRQLRAVELRALTGGTEDMLEQSLARVDATLKRTRFSLITLPPAILLGWLFMRAVTNQPVRSILPTFDTIWGRFFWNGGILILLAVIAAYFVITIRRDRQELERLTTMRDAYREERESSAG